MHFRLAQTTERHIVGERLSRLRGEGKKDKGQRYKLVAAKLNQKRIQKIWKL